MTARALQFVRGLVTGQRGCGCTACPFTPALTTRKVALFGSPNVGKSLIFNHLTGSYAVVSNYPGTTVEVMRGKARAGDVLLDVVDCPGSYALAPSSDDERVAQDLLLDEPPDLVVHVLDAKHLHRMLPLTLQLIETGSRVALDVNVIDEAESLGLGVDTAALSKAVGIPVVATSAATGRGLDELNALLADGPPPASRFSIQYPQEIERAVEQIRALLHGEYGIADRGLALLLLQRDEGARSRVMRTDPESVAEIDRVVSETESLYPQSVSLPIAVARQRAADAIARDVLTHGAAHGGRRLTETLSRLTVSPVTGIPVLLAVLYLIYLVVGRVGAGVVVDVLDKGLFRQHLNPPITAFVERLLPWPAISSLFVGEYGVITLGMRYAFAIILPLVGAFFLVFAVLEDSGYLPRLALLSDRLLKRIGLSGRAVIPIILGLGCDTMATIVTRVLDTRRERVIATFLLALAIPCSAQLGVILGLLSVHPLGLLIWTSVVLGVFLLSGFLVSRILPGEASRFYLEIPPLRLPALRNVLVKTSARLKWYAAEVIPLFLLVSVLIWLGQLTHLFPLLVGALGPFMHLIGLPPEAADAFLFGFLRRDYGAARLFDVSSRGALTGTSLVVAMVTITLFIPCLAQFLVMQKERGLKTAVAVAVVILPLAFSVGFVLNAILRAWQVHI
jgi:ferrous iron transport protein B